MNSDNLKLFLQIAKDGSLSRAASTTFISQPALSRRINMLEKEIGTPLFIRKSTGMELTEAGREFSVRAQQILTMYDTLVEDMSKLNTCKIPSFRIGYEQKLKYVLPPLMATVLQLKDSALKLAISTRGYSVSELYEAYISGEINIALGVRKYLPKKHGSVTALIKRCIFAALVPLNHPFSQMHSLTTADLVDQHIAISRHSFNTLPEQVYQHLEKAGFPYSRYIYCESWEDARIYALLNNCITIIGSLSDANYLEKFFRRIEIANLHLDECDLCAVYQSEVTGIDKFISLLIANALIYE